MICETHRWTEESFPCPYLRCPNGVRGRWAIVGKKKKTVYVRKRTKDEWGPRMEWEQTEIDPAGSSLRKKTKRTTSSSERREQ